MRIMDKTLLAILNIALTTLSKKALTFVALFMEFGICLYAMSQPDWLRVTICVFFGTVICLPLLLSERTHDKTES